uniref:Uncharacterized protein n=1 Tax=Gracilaria chouae TaxID=1172980 RepID=A0A2Z4N618_9FLOR|nr:hypothetical protein GrchoCDS025 [Gracilaria chouae]AWX65725.1 hypothetical protein GrchoCDS025 [Gracilaria chouae]
MNQYRLNNQSNFIEVFDSLDNCFSKNKGTLMFTALNYAQISCKIEKVSKTAFPYSLFLECLIGQKLKFSYNQNLKKRKSLFFVATVRDCKMFLFFEILLHSIFLIGQSVINWYKIRVGFLDFFWPDAVLDKLSMNLILQEKFMIHIR